MYGSTSSCSSVHYAVNSNSEDEIKFLKNVENSDENQTLLPVTTTTVNRQHNLHGSHCSATEPPATFQFQSLVRAKKVQDRVSETKRFFQLYKLRGYLSFLENLQPKVNETCEKIAEFCDEAEESFDTITEDELQCFSAQVEEDLADLSQDLEDFSLVKEKLNHHLSNLNQELGSIEDLMKNIFVVQYSHAEFTKLEEAIQNLYTPSSLKDPPNFDKCLDFIYGSLEDTRWKLLGFKALLRTMENCGKLAKFNAEVIRLAYHVKSLENLTSTEEFEGLWNLFTSTVRSLFSGKFVAISSWEEEAGPKSYLESSEELEGLVRLGSTVTDESLWILRPIVEMKGHYFVIENKKNGNLIGLKREGPEYRQVHHRPLQPGYFNQHWLLLVDNNDRIVFKNRAHYDLVLTSNGQRNVQACLLLHEQLQYWRIESFPVSDS